MVLLHLLTAELPSKYKNIMHTADNQFTCFHFILLHMFNVMDFAATRLGACDQVIFHFLDQLLCFPFR